MNSKVISKKPLWLPVCSIVCILLVIPCVSFGAGKSRGVPSGWFESLEDAKAAAAKEGKHILMCSIVSDSYWGQKQFKEIYNKSAFSGKAKKKFVLMMVDFAKSSKNLSPLAARQNPKLKVEYHLWEYGGGIVIDSDGVMLKRLSTTIEGDPKIIWNAIDAETQDLPVAEKKAAKKSFSSRPSNTPGTVKSAKEMVVESNKRETEGQIERIADTGKSTPPGWMDDFQAAQEVARQQNKLLFVVFSGSDWCGWCKVYSEKVLSVPKFIRAVRDRYVLVYIDSPRDKSLLSEKCVEQNGLVKQMLGASGGVPHTIIATPDAEKLASISGCNKYAQAGADSFLEYFNNIDDALKIIGKAKKTIRDKGLNEDSYAASKIMHGALLKIDEETLVANFLQEAELIVAKDKSYLNDFPYLEFVHPLKNEFNQLRGKLLTDVSLSMRASGQKYSYQAHQAARRKVFLSGGYREKYKNLLEKVDAARAKLKGREKTLKALLDLKAKIYGELNDH